MNVNTNNETRLGSEEMFEKLKGLLPYIEVDLNKFVNSGNKSAAVRARAKLSQVAKLATGLRKEILNNNANPNKHG